MVYSSPRQFLDSQGSACMPRSRKPFPAEQGSASSLDTSAPTLTEGDATHVSGGGENAELVQETLDGSLGEEVAPGTLPSGGVGPARPSLFPPAASPERVQDVVEIGRGGMGAVSSAFDRLLLRRFARKTMHKSSRVSSSATQRFIEEAQITAQLDHPNIVPVHDMALNVEEDKLYFTMKLVDGETLSTVFSRLHKQPLSGREIESVLRVFLKVCDAVSFAHSRGVVHRDLKPDNIMVGSHGQVYVMDWGVALLLSGRSSDELEERAPVTLQRRSRSEEPGTIVGTASYMAPEQAMGSLEQQGVCTDVYGLGAILYCLLTGTGPNVALPNSASMHHAPDPRQRAVWPVLPPGLCDITMRALEPLPVHRYPSVDDLKRDVENFLRGGGWFKTQTFGKGTVIVKEGDESDSAFIVIDGQCEVFRWVRGERQVVRQVGPGEIFGETGLLTRRPRTATVVALSDVRAMLITEEALEQELERSDWMRVLVQALATRFRELDQAHLHGQAEA